ncbi:MAG: phosphatase PAP2 family protein [Thermoleophilia bacterium]|nr:phosphatase PAP2 family protein [Thermoleophilia bacterium]
MPTIPDERPAVAATSEPDQQCEGSRRRFLRMLVIELGIVALGAFTYVFVRDLTQGSPERAVQNAYRLLHVEQLLGIDEERSLVDFTVARPWLRDVANWIYIWGHWPVIIAVATWLFIHHRERYRWLRNAVFASGMIGFLFFALLPMAPPRLTGMGYVDTITVWSSSYRVLQPPSHANLYAATPSLHFGWDLLVGVALFASTSLLVVRILALVMPTLMAFAVIATANHWVLDVVVGLCVVTVGVAVSELIASRGDSAHRRLLLPRRPIEQSRTRPPGRARVAHPTRQPVR